MFALAVPGTIAKAATNNNASAETIARADRCIHPPRPRRGRWVYEITGAPRNVHADSEHSSAGGEPMPGFIKNGDGGPPCNHHCESSGCPERPELDRLARAVDGHRA